MVSGAFTLPTPPRGGNGESAGIQIAPPFAYELPGRAGENTLVIEMATALERQCSPLLDGYRKMLAPPPAGGSGLTGRVLLRTATGR